MHPLQGKRIDYRQDRRISRNERESRREATAKIARSKTGVNWRNDEPVDTTRHATPGAPGATQFTCETFPPERKKKKKIPLFSSLSVYLHDRFHVNYIGECAVEFVERPNSSGPRIIQGQRSIYLSTVYTRHFSLTLTSLGSRG